jgi:GLPGLI family protein
MITLNAANWAQKNKYFHDLAFNIDNATETINGFACKKATAQLPEGKSIVVYFAPDMVPANNDYNNAFSQLPGLPVRYQVESGKLLFTYNLQKIGYESIPSTTFDLPKTGYRIMTYEENQQLRKGGK